MIRRLLPAAAGLLASGNVCAQSLPDGADACLAALEAPAIADEAGAATIGEACPDFAAALADNIWGELLPADGVSTLGAAALSDLTTLAGRYAGTPAGEVSAAGDLDAVVAQLRPFEPLAQPSLWERLFAWIGRWLDESTGETGDRFVEWLRNLVIPEQWNDVAVWAFALLALATVAVVVANEIRHAGVLRAGRRSAPGAGPGKGPHTRSGHALRLADLARLPPREQPPALLALVVDRLRARDPGAVRDSSTHREIAARFASAQARAGAHGESAAGARHAEALAAVAGAAERVTFAGWVPQPQELEPVLASGRDLLAALDAAPLERE